MTDTTEFGFSRVERERLLVEGGGVVLLFQSLL